MTLILTQLDKIILSKMLTLKMFGYYTLAAWRPRLSATWWLPVSLALYPRFTQLVTAGNRTELQACYHRGCQLVSVLILPTVVVFSLFSREILFAVDPQSGRGRAGFVNFKPAGHWRSPERFNEYALCPATGKWLDQPGRL